DVYKRQGGGFSLLGGPGQVAAGVDYASQLNAARQYLGSGNLDYALSSYEYLISAGQYLDETISDLTDLINTKSVEARALRVLGDAYGAKGQLKEALAMYRQALEKF
ncbi:MAG: hypothetical protein GYB68_07505, partial [Chloroflexi bacterium]|nr:hypothetical protein [Chloroflexota bacterium]